MVELGQTALATMMGYVRIIKVKEMISNMAGSPSGRFTESLTGRVCVTFTKFISPFHTYKLIDNCNICKSHNTER